MKILITLIMMLSITNVFARTKCPGEVPETGLEVYAKTADGLACVATRDEYNCARLESELEGAEKDKIIKCDSKSLEANKLSNVNLSECVWNGIKLSVSDLSSIPGKIAEGFRSTQACNQNIEKKREILNAFNMSIDDSRFKLSEQFLGKWLEEAPCSEIEKLLSSRAQNYQNTLMRERQAAILTGKKPASLRSEKEGPGLMEMLKSAMKEAGAVYQCYTPKVKAEIVCTGVTSLLTDMALGGGAIMAVKKIAAIVKSKRALGHIERAVASGEKIDLRDASVLENGDRLRGSRLVLQRKLSVDEEKAILKAHEIGKKEGRGFYTYTQEDISQKARLLREGGFSVSETRDLMESGMAGMFRDPFFKNAMVKHFEKILATGLSVTQQEAMVALHELGKSSSAGFADKARALLKEAKFTDDQIAKILKAKSNEENGIKTVVATTAEKKPEPVAIKPPAPPAVVESPGRKAVLNNFKDDKLVHFKPLEISDDLVGEALEA